MLPAHPPEWVFPKCEALTEALKSKAGAWHSSSCAFQDFSHLLHKLHQVALKHHKSANKRIEDKTSAWRKSGCSFFSSSFAPPRSCFVFALGFPGLSCTQEFPVQSYRSVHAFFRFQDSLFTSIGTSKKFCWSFISLSWAEFVSQHPPDTSGQVNLTFAVWKLSWKHNALFIPRESKWNLGLPESKNETAKGKGLSPLHPGTGTQTCLQFKKNKSKKFQMDF